MSISILFMGPVGAGKTQAIRTISDLHALDTDRRTTCATRLLKPTTTVAMDMGSLQLTSTDKLRLLGTPGQARFDFMWDILLKQASGVILMINHSSADPVADLEHHLSAIEQRSPTRPLPMVVAVTHTDLAPQRSLDLYHAHLQARGCASLPVLATDARDKRQVQQALIALAAQLNLTSATRAAAFPKAARLH